MAAKANAPAPVEAALPDGGTVPSGADISPEELEQRVAILKRFRTLLVEQRDRFRSYLEVLDKQKDVIENGSADELLAHVELEEKIVADIFSIQKVIDPLEEMYRAVNSGKPGLAAGAPQGVRDDVPDLKSALEGLKSEVVIRSNRNKELLSRRMVEIRSEIKTLRNNPYAASARRSSFSSEVGTASLIDIKG
ncbi:hypothetical protein AGMMS50268_21980 [Spirochaetia bacterium]|nr:hypothetical protein AGMMS50268_21980 [Spirochaetia bacterium]